MGDTQVAATPPKDVNVVQQARNTRSSRREQPQYVAAILVNLASFAYGASVGWPSPMLPILQSDETPLGSVPITEDEASWIGSLMFIGFICGTPIFSFFSDKFGRKIAGLLTAVPAIVSWLLIIFGTDVYYIFAARFIMGLNTGGVLVIVPIYVGEIAEDYIRGTLGTLLSVFANGGILFAYAVGSYTLYYDFAIICLSLPILFLITFLWMPETPIYLLRKGKIKEAKRSLKWLRGGKGEHLTEELTKMSLILKEIDERNNCKSNLIKDLLLDKGSRNALIIGVAVSATQMLAGIFAILSYIASIFQLTGSNIPPHISAMIVGALLFIAPILACPLMDRLGRKILLVSSELIMSMCLTLLGLFFYLLEQGFDLSSVGFIPVLCLGVHLFSAGIGLGPINMILLGEIFLPHLRSTSASISTFVMAFLAFIVARFYNDFSNLVGVYGSYWFFAACCLLGALFSIFFIPETKNRSIDSIYSELSGKESSIIPARKSYNMTNTSKHHIVQLSHNNSHVSE
ncbi:facilitated trehalose transporter Tret1-like [Periplaneta americana]|uniref:facilitated trehalose transporter Tret1-like n=1 Tax=Periplaneta americana TaxID=6978 RepID=UPI0037E99B81